MSILLACIYFSLSLVLFYFLSKTNKISLSFIHVALIIIIKFIVGCVYGYLFLKFYNGDDTWAYHQQSLVEFKMLSNNPLLFIKDLFSHQYTNNQSTSFFDTTNNYWKDLQYNILTKLLAVFNIFSRGNYYINVLFFNLLTFWGHYFLYQLVTLYFNNKRAVLFLLIFLFPPLLFWESGIRKDGLVFIGITGSLYFFVLFINKKRYYDLIKALLFFALLAFLRNFIALSLIPVALAYFLSRKLVVKPIYISIITLAIFIILFFVTTLGPQSFNLPQKMADRQEAFLSLEGGSFMALPLLKGTLASYIITLPTAINHIFIRPYLTEAKSPLLTFAAIETLLVLLVVCSLVLFLKKIKTITNHPLLMLLLSLSIINYLMIGYTVPFAGAIVRYRVFFEVCLLVPMLVALDTNNYLENGINKVLKLY